MLPRFPPLPPCQIWSDALLRLALIGLEIKGYKAGKKGLQETAATRLASQIGDGSVEVAKKTIVNAQSRVRNLYNAAVQRVKARLSGSRGAITAVPRNLMTGKPIDAFLDGQQRIVATFNNETGNLFINKIGMGNLKGLGRSHEAYAEAIRQTGPGLKTIAGKMASDNLKALKAGGFDVSQTASAKALQKLGFTEHFLIEVTENGKTVYYRVSRRP